ncbi:MAG: heme-binding protein [Acidobacteriota bacterium]|nr:heme-binding protein [Acidobacteriota bacterium]
MTYRDVAKLLWAAAVLAAAAGPVAAQNLSKFVVSDEAAKKTLIKNEINGETAAKIAQACVDFAVKNNQTITVFILSPTGQIVHSHRMDGQVPINIEAALLKAKSVLYTRDSTHLRANRMANNLALQMRWEPLGVFPTAGGLPIVVDGQMIGAIGVGGGENDEEFAYQALTSVVGPQPPLAGPSPERRQQ